MKNRVPIRDLTNYYDTVILIIYKIKKRETTEVESNESDYNVLNTIIYFNYYMVLLIDDGRLFAD